MIATNHNGGAIHFGTDGMLYADVGDNVQTFVQGGNTYRVSQTLSNLLGKQLRIDVSKFNQGVATRDDTTVGHLIPSNNPFVGTATGINQLIYVLGLRNPFTFAVQPGTGVHLHQRRGREHLGGDRPERRRRATTAGAAATPTASARLRRGRAPTRTRCWPTTTRAVRPGGGHRHRGRDLLRPGLAAVPRHLRRQVFLRRPGRQLDPRLRSGQSGHRTNPDTSQAFATDIAGGLRDMKVDAAGSLYYLAGDGGVIHKISYSPAPGDAGFERPSAGPAGAYGSYIYRATGSAWTFAGGSRRDGQRQRLHLRQPRRAAGGPGGLPPGRFRLPITQAVAGWTAGDLRIDLRGRPAGPIGRAVIRTSGC